MRNRILSLISFLIIISCQSLEQPKKPSHFIGEDKMIDILTDIAFIKAAKGSFRKKLEIEKINPEAYILNKHGIDSITFSENNIWYTYHTEEYEKIFTKVKENLNQSKTAVEKLKKEQDSINKINDSIKAEKNKIKDSLSKKSKISLKNKKPKTEKKIISTSKNKKQFP